MLRDDSLALADDGFQGSQTQEPEEAGHCAKNGLSVHYKNGSADFDFLKWLAPSTS
jgi:hypothetical protein